MDTQDLQVFRASADDAALLARLHDRELDESELLALAASPVREWLWLDVTGDGAAEGRSLMEEGLSADAAEAGLPLIDALASDFAEIYLTFGKRVSPSESYWLTEDQLERQAPMFEVRTWLEHYGLATADWRKQADDHLVTQLMFLSNLLREGTAETLGDAAHFLDQHLLRWSKDFFAGVATRAGTSFYAGLAILTEAWLQTLRDALHRATGVARVSIEPEAEKQVSQDHVAPFIPGAAPSW